MPPPPSPFKELLQFPPPSRGSQLSALQRRYLQGEGGGTVGGTGGDGTQQPPHPPPSPGTEDGNPPHPPLHRAKGAGGEGGVCKKRRPPPNPRANGRRPSSPRAKGAAHPQRSCRRRGGIFEQKAHGETGSKCGILGEKSGISGGGGECQIFGREVEFWKEK